MKRALERSGRPLKGSEGYSLRRGPTKKKEEEEGFYRGAKENEKEVGRVTEKIRRGSRDH